MAITDALFEYEPIYYWSKVFCASPFNMYISNHERSFKQSVWASASTAVLFTAYVAVLILNFHSVFQYLDTAIMSRPYVKYVSYIIFMTNVVIVCITVPQFIFNSSKIINCVDILKEVDGILEKYGSRIENSLVRRVGFLLISIYTVLFSYQAILHLRSKLSISGFILIYPVLVDVTFRIQFIMWCLIFTERFKTINNYLSTLSKFPKTDEDGKVIHRFRNNAQRVCFNAEDLTTLSSVRSRLCYCMREINNVYALHALLSCTVFFVWVTVEGLLVISCLFNFMHVSLATFIYMLFWFVYSIIDYNMYLWICAQVAYHANDTKKHLIRFKLNAQDKEMQREMVNFLVQLVDDDLEITALGFFKLDIPFIQTITTAVTTYVIILLQSLYT